MPLVVPEVTPEPVNPPRLQPEGSVETFGGGQGLESEGQQLEKIASTGGEIATFERIRHDQTAVEEAVGSKLSPALTKLMYDPKDGAIAKISQSTSVDDALKIQQDTLKQYNKMAKGFASDLNGEAQVGAYNKHALAFGDTLNKTLMTHVDQQIKAHDAKSFDSFIDNSIAQGALAYGDPKTRSTLLEMMDQHANAYAARNGMGKDEVDNMKMRINSNFHDRVIGQMLADKQDVMANKYWTENKDQITDPQIRERVQKSLEEGSYRGESQRKTDEIWVKTDGNLAKGYALADKESDPELRDRIHQRLREKDNEVKEARTSEEDNNYFEASRAVGAALKAGQPKGDASIRDAVGPDRWVNLTPAHQDALKRLWLNDQNSDQVWTNYNLMSPTDKAGQSQADFETDVLSRLDKAHRDKAMAMRNSAMGNRVTAITDHDQAKLIERSAQESGIIPGVIPGKSVAKLRGDAAAQYGAFQEQVQNAVSDFERNELGGRRRASQQETQKIIDQKIIDTLSSTKPNFFTSVGRNLGLSAKPSVSFDQIPDDAREHILIKARQMGKAVTKEQIESAYTAYQNKDLKGVMKALQ